MIPRTPHRYRARGGRFSVSRTKRPPLSYTGFEGPQALNALLSLLNGPPTPDLGWFHVRPTDNEPTAGHFRFRAPKRPPPRVPGSRAPGPSTPPSPSSIDPPPPIWGGSRYIPLITSPQWAIFGFARQRPLACTAFEGPRALNPSLSLFNRPPTVNLGWFHVRPTDNKPAVANFQFRAPNSPPLSYAWFEGPRALNLPLSLFNQPPTIAFRWFQARPTDIEPVWWNFIFFAFQFFFTYMLASQPSPPQLYIILYFTTPYYSILHTTFSFEPISTHLQRKKKKTILELLVLQYFM